MKRRSLLAMLGITAGGLAVSKSAIAIAGIDDRLPRTSTDSEAAADQRLVALNQVGYLPSGEKVITFLATDSANRDFQIVSSADGKVVFRGPLSAPVEDSASGDRVVTANFTACTTPGSYRIVAQGQRSDPFFIGKDAYRLPLKTAMRAFYGQRCGCAVDLGDGYSHPACHRVGAYHPSSGRGGPLDNHGGWHDAGDYGRYVVNSGITTGTLLWAWELYPGALRNLKLAIPESGTKLPDYLAEIRWNLEWMLQMQDDDGGVWHKQTSEQFCEFIMPQADLFTSYVIGTGAAPFKSTCATADLAAVMAIAARCYQSFDAAFAAQCLTAARRAWSWAMAHPDVPFQNPKGVTTGEYGDVHCNDELLWASAELWRTTGDVLYEQAFLTGTESLPPEHIMDAPGWGSYAPMACWTYLLAEHKSSRLATSSLIGASGTTPDAVKSRIQTETARAAQLLIARHKTSGYGNTLAIGDYVWGSNGIAANQSLLLLLAHHLQPDPEAVEAALGNLHYLLGRNCFAVSWVTQVGTNPFQHPHHRPSVADKIAAPWPGLLSGGPNARPADPVALQLSKSPPMRMWLDEQAAYSLNEVAINWNAPLVFLLAGANALAS
jgi:endoglucanase